MSNLYYDFIIFSYIIALPFLIYLLLRDLKKAKHKKWNVFLMSILSALFMVIFYGSFIEPWRIKIDRQAIELPEVSKEIRIAFITDTHIGPYKGETFVKLVDKKIKEIDPDIIIFGGDYIFEPDDNIEPLRYFKEITADIPSFAVMGNHEYNIGREYNIANMIDTSEPIGGLLKSIGVTVLNNDDRLINIGGQDIYIIGIDDYWAQKDDLKKAVKGLSPSIPQILISHNPDGILEAQYTDIDLVLSGHTHGGQIRLPWIGPVVQGRHTKLGRAFYRGLFKFKGTWLLVSAGLGESGPRARLFCRPELNVITLK